MNDVSSVMFVCTGNYYRSRLAEVLFRFHADRRGIAVRAESRGLAVGGQLVGMASEAREYAATVGVEGLILRNPLPLLVDELAAAQMVVLMNRAEHEPMIEREFRPVFRRLVADGRVRFWNVFDIPSRKSHWRGGPPPSQPAASSTEHIDFAVRVLVSELAGEE